MHDSHLQQTAEKLATVLAFHCVRNSSLEALHAGTFPSSKTGDYTDVKVVSPYGEIAWNQVGRISDEEMKPLMEEIVDRLYTFLVLLLDSIGRTIRCTSVFTRRPPCNRRHATTDSL